MKKIINWIIALFIIGLIIWGIYKVFFDCEKTNTYFGRNFVLEKFDYAKVEEEAIVKLLGIDDNRCKEENCERTGEYVAKILVVNDHRISYVKLGTLSEPRKYIEKMGYTIEVLEVTEDGKVTLNLVKDK